MAEFQGISPSYLAKQRKRQINGERIYPPKGGRDALLAAAEIVAPAPAA